jgi:pyruvate,water dikinase
MTLPVLGADDAGDLRDLGGKAAPLSRLRRSGFPVPAGFVVPVPVFARHARASGARAAGNIEEAQERLLTHGADEELRTALAAALDALPGGRDTPVAVRSSATAEDAPGTAAAGVHDSFLGSRGPSAVTEAVLRCWTSWWSPRDLRPAPGTGQDGADGMAVLVQVLVDADAAGVLFTGERRVLEAVHGLGERLVGGAVTPDSWELGDDGDPCPPLGIAASCATVRRGDRVLREPLPAALRGHRAPLGPRSACERSTSSADASRCSWAGPSTSNGPSTGRACTCSRPVRSPRRCPPRRPGRRRRRGHAVDGAGAAPPGTVLRGVGASGGTATGTVRVLRSVTELSRVRPGDVLLARSHRSCLDPALPADLRRRHRDRRHALARGDRRP